MNQQRNPRELEKYSQAKMKDTNETENFTEQVGVVVFSTLMCCISITGSFTNIVVIFSILANENLRTKTNYIVLSLAISDFCSATVGIPVRLLQEHSTSSKSLVPCNVVLVPTILFDGVSRLSVMLISFDRFITVKCPFTYSKLLSKKVTVAVITSFWTIMIAFAVCLLSGVGLRDHGAGERALVTSGKQHFCHLQSTLSKAAVMTFSLGLGVLPILIVIPLNFYLVKTSYSHFKKINDLQKNLEANYSLQGKDLNDTRKQSQLREKAAQFRRKRAKMVAVLVCLFLVLVAPITFIDAIETLTDLMVPSSVFKIALLLIYSNTAVNMVVYAAFNREFREAFIRIFVKLRNRCSNRR